MGPLGTSRGSGAKEFIDLNDAPNDYSGQSGKFVSVKDTEDALEFVDASSGSSASSLDGMSDVNIIIPSNGDVLTYDSGSAVWVNEAPSGGGGETDVLMVQVFS